MTNTSNILTCIVYIFMESRDLNIIGTETFSILFTVVLFLLSLKTTKMKIKVIYFQILSSFF